MIGMHRDKVSHHAFPSLGANSPGGNKGQHDMQDSDHKLVSWHVQFLVLSQIHADSKWGTKGSQ